LLEKQTFSTTYAGEFSIEFFLFSFELGEISKIHAGGLKAKIGNFAKFLNRLWQYIYAFGSGLKYTNFRIKRAGSFNYGGRY
jgi:hypothetical protein